MYKPGTIVLVPFPFTDLSGMKVRPALILAAEPKAGDVLVSFITSIDPKTSAASVKILPDEPLFARTGLKTVSYIRVTKIATLDKKVILGELGVLDAKLFAQVKSVLKSYLHI